MDNNFETRIARKTDQLINLLALGMIITVLPAVFRVGVERSNLFVSFMEWAVYIGSVMAGFGLILRVYWAPSFAVRILMLTFGWVLYQIVFYNGASGSKVALSVNCNCK